MTAPKISESDFVSLFERIGPAKLARQLNSTMASVFRRRANLEKKLHRQITAPADSPNQTRHAEEYPGRLTHKIKNGIILIGSDAHYYPGVTTTAHRAFVKFCKELKPALVVCNGDVFDGASISRHPPLGTDREDIPTVVMELEECAARLGDIEKAAFKARKVWPLGNHDARFSVRLATTAPEFAKVHGFALKDHFPAWEPCWSIFINDDVVIKHRLKSGIHAVFNNAKDSGRTMVTGHLHSLKVVPYTDYNGTRWGVDTGTLASPWGPQFEYLEDGPRNWRGGFVVLTFENGELRWPEIVHVLDEETVEFRGKSIKV